LKKKVRTREALTLQPFSDHTKSSREGCQKERAPNHASHLKAHQTGDKKKTSICKGKRTQQKGHMIRALWGGKRHFSPAEVSKNPK